MNEGAASLSSSIRWVTYYSTLEPFSFSRLAASAGGTTGVSATMAFSTTSTGFSPFSEFGWTSTMVTSSMESVETTTFSSAFGSADGPSSMISMSESVSRNEKYVISC